jgi:hypothetical protein
VKASLVLPGEIAGSAATLRLCGGVVSELSAVCETAVPDREATVVSKGAVFSFAVFSSAGFSSGDAQFTAASGQQQPERQQRRCCAGEPQATSTTVTRVPHCTTSFYRRIYRVPCTINYLPAP